MTPREYEALVKVYEASVLRWATSCAMFANANFVEPNNPLWKPWKPEHFMGEPREQQNTIADARARVSHMLAMWKGDKDEDIPDWAKRLGGVQ